MPELPEVESARAAIERAALGRRITGVDDTDTWVCRPHPPGEISAALAGRPLTGAFRRGKSMWCETSGVGGSRTPGPILGLHLGMSGHVLISAPGGELTEGGDWLGPRTGRAAERVASIRFGAGSPSRSATAVRCGSSTSAGWGGSGSTPTSMRWDPTPSRSGCGSSSSG